MTLDGVVQDPTALSAYQIQGGPPNSIYFPTIPASGTEITVRLLYGAIGATGPSLSVVELVTQTASCNATSSFLGKLVVFENTADIVVTVGPNSADVPIGGQFMFMRKTTSEVEFVPSIGFTLIAPQGNSLYRNGSLATLMRLDTLVWVLNGDLF